MERHARSRFWANLIWRRECMLIMYSPNNLESKFQRKNKKYTGKPKLGGWTILLLWIVNG